MTVYILLKIWFAGHCVFGKIVTDDLRQKWHEGAAPSLGDHLGSPMERSIVAANLLSKSTSADAFGTSKQCGRVAQHGNRAVKRREMMSGNRARHVKVVRAISFKIIYKNDGFSEGMGVANFEGQIVTAGVGALHERQHSVAPSDRIEVPRSVFIAVLNSVFAGVKNQIGLPETIVNAPLPACFESSGKVKKLFDRVF